MPATTLDRTDPGGAAPVRGPRLRAARENEMTLLSQDLSRERIPATVPDELAARVRALRRARWQARTRASRVTRVLLAPTTGEAYAQVPAPRHRH
ncbi:Uncharacterised protein [Actinomadura madurae]|nr:Uncharacterised protein [Actinomadura madurae]